MKKNVLILFCVAMAFWVTGCNADDGTIADAIKTFEELEQVYDEAAPFVAVSDDSAVKLYEEAGKVYRSAGRVIDAEFDDYSKKDVKKLIQQMDEQIRILDSLAQEPVKKVKPKKDADKKTYALRIQNETQMPFYTVELKSGSGDYDMPVALAGELMPSAEVSVALQAPANEKFTVVATDEAEKEISFSGAFYLSDKAVLELLCEDGKYSVQMISSLKTEEPKPEATETTEQTAE